MTAPDRLSAFEVAVMVMIVAMLVCYAGPG